MFIQFLPLYVFCQNVEGQVIDSLGLPLEFVNVVFLSRKDTTFINGAGTDSDGKFSIDSKGKQGFLRFSRIGYSTLVMNVDGQQVIKAVLNEDRNTLSEVVIKSNLPKTILKDEGMLTNIAGSFLEKAGTLEHVLSYIPNIIIIDGKVQVLGRGVPDFYLNGHKVIDRMELKNLRGDNIKNIEVINNPGARYGAATKSVIRITTKTRKEDSWGVDMSSSYGINEEKRFSTTNVATLNFHYKKMDISSSLYCDYSNTEDDKLVQQFTYLDNVWEKNNNIIQEYTNVNPYAKLAISYQLNDSTSLGVRASYDRFAKNYGSGTMDAVVTKDSNISESSHSYYESPANSTAVTTNAYYVGKVGKLTVDFNIDYYWYNKKEHMYNNEWIYANMDATSEKVETSRNSFSYQLASKINLTIPLFGGHFSWGGELSDNKRKSKYDVLPINLLNNERSTVEEKAYSSFCDYNRRIGNAVILMGVRYENTNFKYYSHEEYVPSQSKRFSDLFPSLSISFPIGDSQIQVNYASDINRPSYYQLRNGIQYDNRYTYESGNPYLLPSKSRNLGFYFTWSSIAFSAIYSHISDEICSIVKPYGENMQISIMRPENMESYNKIQTNLSLSPSIGFWHPQLKAAISKQWFYMSNPNSKSLSNPIGTFHINNTFDTKWFMASLLMTVQTEGNMGNCFTYSYWNTDISLYKTLLKDRLTIQLYANDIFGTANLRRVIYSGKQSCSNIKSYSSSSVMLTVRYALNAKKDKYKGTGAGIQQRKRL